MLPTICWQDWTTNRYITGSTVIAITLPLYRRTEEFPVTEHFNGEGHTVVYISPQITGKQVDQNPWDLTSFRMNLRVDSLWHLLDDHPWSEEGLRDTLCLCFGFLCLSFPPLLHSIGHNLLHDFISALRLYVLWVHPYLKFNRNFSPAYFLFFGC